MLSALATFIENTIVTLGAGGVFIGSVMEEIIVPIPSSLVQAGAGLFLLGGEPVTFTSVLKLITWVALPAALGVSIGSLLIYFIVYYGGMPAIRRFGKYFLIDPNKVEEARVRIASKHSTLYALTALRFIPLLPNALVTAAAGLLRIKLWPYLYSTFIGVFIRAIYLGAIGWATGRVAGGSEQNFYVKLGILLSGLLLISLVTTLIVRHVRKKKRAIS
jgi:membrane protein DedA with SNARE-associated domain